VIVLLFIATFQISVFLRSGSRHSWVNFYCGYWVNTLNIILCSHLLK